MTGEFSITIESHEYRNADDRAVSFTELREMFEGLEELFYHFEISPKHTGPFETIHQRLQHFGVYDPAYEITINRYRNLIEDSYQFMTLNTFKQRVPRKTLEKFKNTMADVTAVVRKNKQEREMMVNYSAKIRKNWDCFFAKDLELKYAMPVSRSKKTNKVINTPEVILKLRGRLIEIQHHHHIFTLLKIINPVSGMTYRDYLDRCKKYTDKGKSHLKVMINSHLTRFPNAFIDSVKISDKGCIIGFAGTVSVTDHKLTGEPPRYQDWDMSAYCNQHGKVINFSKNNHIIEVIVKPSVSIITHRYCDDNGYTMGLTSPSRVNRHINRLNLSNLFSIRRRPFEFAKDLRNGRPIPHYMNIRPSVAGLSLLDRNLLESQRLQMYLAEYADEK